MGTEAHRPSWYWHAAWALMDRKAFSAIEWKGDKGSFKATIATFNVVDKDGDVTFPGAFPIGKQVPISAYGHTSWEGALPVGMGVIGADEKTAWIEGKFFTDTTAGLDTYKTVKNLGALGEWSYGFNPKKTFTSGDAEMADFAGAWRGLGEVDPFEASPVLLGAGVNTRTESIKSAKLSKGARALALRIKQQTADPVTLAQIAQIDFHTDALDELVDSVMDSFGLVDPDEDAAGATADEGPFGEAEQPKGFTFGDHAEHARASVQAIAKRAVALRDLRRKEGRTLSAATRTRLTSLADVLGTSLTDIQKLLDEADVDPDKASAQQVWLAMAQRDHALRTTEMEGVIQ